MNGSPRRADTRTLALACALAAGLASAACVSGADDVDLPGGGKDPAGGGGTPALVAGTGGEPTLLIPEGSNPASGGSSGRAAPIGSDTGGDTAASAGGAPTGSGGTTTHPGVPIVPATGGSNSGPITGGQTLPFAVDDVYFGYGVMGDVDDLFKIPASEVDEATCWGFRAHDDAVGYCHTATYQPAGPIGWAGVYWQSPANNWGGTPAPIINTGATGVTFYARGSRGGETVRFMVGGMEGDGMPFQDDFSVAQVIALTTEWTEYTLDLTGTSYTRVLGGFGFSAEASLNDGLELVEFYIDDIIWH